MWALNFLPDWVFHLILVVGVLGLIASYFFKFVPFITTYRIQLQVVSIILTVLGVWYEGGIAKDREYRERIAELKLQVAQAEKAAAEANAKIEYVYVDRIKVVEKIKYEVLNSIRESSSELDANCVISPKAIEILNKAAGKAEDKK